MEFLMLFPFVVAMLYASAIYGIVFFSQYRLQNVVDRAVATALYVDRSAFQGEQMESAVVNRASQAMSGLLATLPGPLSNLEGGASSCAVENLHIPVASQEDYLPKHLKLMCRDCDLRVWCVGRAPRVMWSPSPSSRGSDL